MSTSPSNVVSLPVWKCDATPEERFLELAQLAREDPERFKKMVVVWWGVRDGKTTDNYVSTGCNVFEVIGLLGVGIRHAEGWNLEP